MPMSNNEIKSRRGKKVTFYAAQKVQKDCFDYWDLNAFFNKKRVKN